MIEVLGDTLLSSDWHVLHRNIYWFLPVQRGALSGASDPQRLSADEFIEAERATYRRVLDAVESLLGSPPTLRRFMFLGDLVFGLNRGGGVSALVERLRAEVPVFFEIFQVLKAAGLRRVLVLGNHDDFKLHNRVARSLYEELFDEVVLFQREGQTLFTHFPLGYNRACDATRGTRDEKYYRMHKSFHALDTRLLGELDRAPIVNYHGHIHAGPFAYPLPEVTYRNVALDILSQPHDPAPVALSEHVPQTHDGH